VVFFTVDPDPPYTFRTVVTPSGSVTVVGVDDPDAVSTRYHVFRSNPVVCLNMGSLPCHFFWCDIGVKVFPGPSPQVRAV
jgi:hypothetical protein